MDENFDLERCREFVQKRIDIDFFNIISEPVRSELLIFLASHGEMTIGEIAETFPQNRSGISRHLDTMNRLGIVTRRKVGREVFYTVNRDQIIDKFETATTNMKVLLHK